MKLNYSDYTLDDFMIDDKFINWVINPTIESDTFWNQWISQHPGKEQIVLSAKSYIKNIHRAEEQFSIPEPDAEVWQKIKSQTIDKKSIPHPAKSIKLSWLKYAAVLAPLFCMSLYFFLERNVSPTHTSEQSAWILNENISGVAKNICLADGSTVVLEPYSTLKYPKVFNEKQRDVFLQGEAFFDVARDTTQPFLIYADGTITKVLGTSFTIKAFEGDREVEVEVKTGKVAVYANVVSENSSITNKQMVVKADKDIFVPLPNQKMEITPNQKAVFNKKKKELIKTISPLPVLIKKSVTQIKKFEFVEEPVAEVFEALEFAYGLKVSFDKDQLKNCTITTALNDMPMIDKIKIICEALSLKYEEKDGVIYIYGHGC